MIPLKSDSERSALTLGQLMGLVAAMAGFLSLIATAQTVASRSSSAFYVTCGVLSYTGYLLLLVLISIGFYSRDQVLVVLAITGGFAALLLQAATYSTGWTIIPLVLVLPFVPLVVAGVMLRSNLKREDEVDTPRETATLATLVHNKRGRGLRPQAAGSPEPEPRRGSPRRTLTFRIVIGVVVVLAAMGLDAVRRRQAFLTKVYELTREEARCREQAMLLGEHIDLLESAGPPSLEQMAMIADQKDLIRGWTRSADRRAAEIRALESQSW